MIHTSRLSVRLRGTLAVDGVDLDLTAGVHAVLGPNGSGKSTLLRTLATAVAPAEGTLRLLGRDPRAPSALREIRCRLGYLPQKFGLYRHYTVREFLTYVAWLREMPGRRVPAAVEEAVEHVRLTHCVDVRIRRLSDGMRQRVGIAQALLNRPELLVLDEPAVGLDAESRAALASVLRDIAENGCVVVSTHHLEEVSELASTATLLDRGKVAFHGSLADMPTG